MRVVIVDYDGADVLPRCLESLAASISPDIPVTVIDNASPVKSETLVPENLRTRIDILKLPENSGYAGAIAKAWDIGNEEFIVIANNDLEFQPGWLEKLVGTAERTGAYAVSAVIEHDGESELEKSTNASLNPLFYLIPGVFKDRTKAVYPSGACFLLRRDKNLSAVPVDPTYFLYYEDVYIGFFLRALGKEVVQCPDAVVKHAGSHSVKRSNPNRVAFLQERNRLVTQILFLDFSTLVSISPYIIFDSIIKPISCLVRKKPFWATVGAHWWVLFHLSSLMRKHRELRRTWDFDARRNYPYLTGKFLSYRATGAALHNALSELWWKHFGFPEDEEADE